MPEKSVDLIFADPPYNLQLRKELHRPNMTKVDAVNDSWDQFATFEDYDKFTIEWLTECKRILKPTGAIWVIGSYHNIFRVGKIMQDLGYWILNDVVWVKTNPMPNFRGVRFTNAHETLIWASRNKGGKYTFNHHAMKNLNGDLQMRSDWWLLSLATGKERIKDEAGKKVHSTQKPMSLLYRVIVSSSKLGDVVLDPFFGSGTTGAVAKILGRKWIGIELDKKYIKYAQKRIDDISSINIDEQVFEVRSQKKLAPRIDFSSLVEENYLRPGDKLIFKKNLKLTGAIKPDGRVRTSDGFEGSIHAAGSHYMKGSPCNGWDHWFVKKGTGMMSLDEIRQKYLSDNKLIQK